MWISPLHPPTKKVHHPIWKKNLNSETNNREELPSINRKIALFFIRNHPLWVKMQLLFRSLAIKIEEAIAVLTHWLLICQQRMDLPLLFSLTLKLTQLIREIFRVPTWSEV